MTRFSSLVLVLGLVACDQEQPPTPQEKQANAASPQATSKGDDASAPSKKGKPALDPSSKSSRGTKTGAACLAGKWSYDFKDNAMETMMKSIANAKVLKEEGLAACTIVGDKEWSMTCAPEGGKPVIYSVAGDAGGMPFQLDMKIHGTGSSTIALKDEKTLRIRGGTDGLQVEADVTVAGNKVPFPGMDALKMFGGSEGEVQAAFECNGKTLKLLHQVDGLKTDWQVLKRLK